MRNSHAVAQILHILYFHFQTEYTIFAPSVFTLETRNSHLMPSAPRDLLELSDPVDHASTLL